MEEQKKSIWQRVRWKYRIAVVNETTLEERMHLRLSLWNLITLFVVLTLLTLALFALLIWKTPLKNYLPGFNAEVREQLMDETARVDSLLNILSVQQEYFSSIRSVVAGEVESDSVPPLDSLYLIKKAELLAVQSQVTEDFIRSYEEDERDNLNLFDKAVQNDALANLYRPASGVIASAFSADASFPGVRIQTADDANVTSVLNGTVVSVAYSVRERWTVIVQHDADYVTISSSLEKPLCSVGTKVRAGESIGLASSSEPVGFQIWKRGHAVNPETIIAF